MLKTIIRKELLENLLSYRFPLFFLICAVLVLTSFIVHNQSYIRQVRDYNEQVRIAGEEMAASRMSDLFMGRIPIRGFLPPAPLAVFASGFSTLLPKSYDFLAEGAKPGPSSSGDESILSTFGKLDFVFIVQMVASLIVLLFASDVIAGEKEMGTLRAVLANGVPRHTLLLGKLSGGFLTIWIPFLLTFLLGLFVLGILSFPLGQAGMGARLAAIFAAASVFLLSYYVIGLMISASSARSRTSLVVILLVWIGFQVVIPRLSDMFASLVHPTRTEAVVSMQKSLVNKTIDREKAVALGAKYEELFGRPRQDAPPPPPEKTAEYEAFQADWNSRAQSQKNSQIREIESSYQREKQRQRRLSANISLLSPSAAFSRLLTDFCGTGEIDRSGYYQSVKDHQRTLDAELYGYVQKQTLIYPSGGSGSSSKITKTVDLKTLPVYSYRRSSLGEAVAGNLGSLFSLAFWLIAPFAVAYVRFLRYDVR